MIKDSVIHDLWHEDDHNTDVFGSLYSPPVLLHLFEAFICDLINEDIW